MQFSLDRKQRRHKQNQCSASDYFGLIFTRSYRSTLLITTPSLVKTSLKVIPVKLFLDIVPSSSENVNRAMRGQLEAAGDEMREYHCLCFDFVP